MCFRQTHLNSCFFLLSRLYLWVASRFIVETDLLCKTVQIVSCWVLRNLVIYFPNVGFFSINNGLPKRLNSLGTYEYAMRKPWWIIVWWIFDENRRIPACAQMHFFVLWAFLFVRVKKMPPPTARYVGAVIFTPEMAGWFSCRTRNQRFSLWWCNEMTKTKRLNH